DPDKHCPQAKGNVDRVLFWISPLSSEAAPVQSMGQVEVRTNSCQAPDVREKSRNLLKESRLPSSHKVPIRYWLPYKMEVVMEYAHHYWCKITTSHLFSRL